MKKKLVIKKETLQEISGSALKQVFGGYQGGGASDVSDVCCDPNQQPHAPQPVSG